MADFCKWCAKRINIRPLFRFVNDLLNFTNDINIWNDADDKVGNWIKKPSNYNDDNNNNDNDNKNNDNHKYFLFI